jgi:hypothetical protein
MVVPAEVAAELRFALGVDLLATLEQLRIAAEDAERALEAQDTADLASRIQRFRDLAEALDARRRLYIAVGLPIQPIVTCTIDGDGACTLCIELLLAHRKTLVEHLADSGHGKDRASAMQAVQRLTSFLRETGIDPTRLTDVESRAARNGR